MCHMDRYIMTNGASHFTFLPLHQAARANNGKSSAVIVTINPFTDPDGNPVNVTITSVAANRGLAAKCPCTAAQRRAGCSCVPDATIIAGGRAVSLLPLLRTNDASRKEVGTTVRIQFTATSAATGQSCSGYADLCSVRGLGQ